MNRGARVLVALLVAWTVHCTMNEQPSTPPRVLGTLPEFTLSDQRGEPYGSSDLAGKVWIANFIFTRCGSTCPRQTAEMTRLQQEFGSGPQTDELRLVSLTVDPQYDTPDVLQEYARHAGANGARWKFLTGDRSVLLELSRAGFKLAVRDTPDNLASIIAHSQQFVLVDGQSRIRGYYDGLDARDKEALLRDTRSLLAEVQAAD